MSSKKAMIRTYKKRVSEIPKVKKLPPAKDETLGAKSQVGKKIYFVTMITDIRGNSRRVWRLWTEERERKFKEEYNFLLDYMNQ